ncbi:Cof-type HAD-IIB family hydrolase [Halalkalibacter sp. APA_J-10(15)]|uniref:Cof-type HAD-IIB family hydrolase n=1 Tax=unclassified Halalkalibacter TaxID=2893063 RepID=UPI001FF60B6F|nr:Cof-type HAD-IIB family hydrolase [Halalkalibacter sp. APA_J-10(15)]MCK0472668.1 Cof-type HAD-IIB family hydrolase [Halalkalibacter sp. APA_J-10(15)]
MNPNQHLIVLDLDGTLLKDDKTISPYTKQILTKARQNGHLVMIATGRPYRASAAYYQELQLDTAIVNFNGAFVHHPRDKKFGTYHHPLKLETAKTIIQTCEAFKVSNIMVEVIDDFYLHSFDEVIIKEFLAGQNPVEHGNLLKQLKDDPTSILVHPEEHHVDELRQLLKDAHAEVIDQRMWGAPWHIIEIIRAGMNKAIGIKKAADYYNIPKERIIAFGDEDNDFEMIEYAGQGVAMSNAITPLKSIANEVTSSNEEDGIGHYLEDALRLS